VAPSGSISLSRLLRLARRPSLPIPHPLFGPALGRLGSRLGAGPLYGDGVRFLRFGRGVDNRRLRTELGFEPSFDAEAVARDFAGKIAGRRIGPSLHPGDLADRLAGVGR
jgi:UDP-glucose 4-epimerase